MRNIGATEKKKSKNLKILMRKKMSGGRLYVLQWRRWGMRGRWSWRGGVDKSCSGGREGPAERTARSLGTRTYRPLRSSCIALARLSAMTAAAAAAASKQVFMTAVVNRLSLEGNNPTFYASFND